MPWTLFLCITSSTECKTHAKNCGPIHEPSVPLCTHLSCVKFVHGGSQGHAMFVREKCPDDAFNPKTSPSEHNASVHLPYVPDIKVKSRHDLLEFEVPHSMLWVVKSANKLYSGIWRILIERFMPCVRKWWSTSMRCYPLDGFFDLTLPSTNKPWSITQE